MESDKHVSNPVRNGNPCQVELGVNDLLEKAVVCHHCGKTIDCKAFVKGFSVICPFCEMPL
ncbi:MAG: hypothetical protein ABH879_03095 [archaeon]